MALFNRTKQTESKPRRMSSEVGVAGDVVFEGFDREEARTDKISIKELRKMIDKDPTVESLYNIFTLPIVAATYRIDADEDDDDEQQAELVRDNLFKPPNKGGMELPFSLFLDQLLFSVVDGFQLWEKVYKLQDGKMVIKKLAHRDSLTLTLMRDDEGGYGGARQLASYGEKTIDVVMKPYKTFLFTHNKARSFLYGRSSLTSLRDPYMKKRRLEWLDSISLQADAIKPKILKRVADNIGSKDPTGLIKKTLDGLSRLGERRSAASVPYGYDVDVVNSEGRSPHESIERQNSEMARAFLATFTLLGSQGKSSNTGSYALSDNLSDLMMISLKAYMTKIEEHINQYIIADIINYNYATPHYPEFHFDDLTSDVVEVITESFKKLIEKDRISDDMAKAIEDAAANRLEIDLEQIKRDREEQAKKDAAEAKRAAAAKSDDDESDDDDNESTPGDQQLSDELNKDFYDDLPGAVAAGMSKLIDEHGSEPWFSEAWEKYRQHVLNASIDDMKMPGYVFNQYIKDKSKQLSDSNANDGGSAGDGDKFLSDDGNQWHRPLTEAEKTVRFAEIDKKMDGFEQSFLTEIQPVVDELIESTVDGAAGADPAKFDVLMPPNYDKVIFNTIRDAYNYAKTGAADELKASAPATSKEAVQGMRDLTVFIVEKQQDDLKNLVRGELLKAKRQGIELADDKKDDDKKMTPAEKFKAALGITLGAWFVKKLKDTATSIVSQGVNNGRGDVFVSVNQKGDVYQYSGLLDEKICNICSDLDGKTVTPEEYRRTQWIPPIHFNCRCLWILIRKVSDTFKMPEITGLPDEAGGKTEPLL